MSRIAEKQLLSRRLVLLGGISTVLSSCAESPIIVNAYEALKYSIVGFPDAPISRKIVSKLPYASISAKIGIGPRSLLVLWRRERDDLHWISADRAIIVTRYGRVVKTYGLPENIKATQEIGVDPVNKTLHVPNSRPTFRRTIDIDIDHRYSLPIESDFEAIGPREITIEEVKIKTILFAERNTARTINWSFTNYFWVDAFDGFVWKSRQHIARQFDPIEIEVLKPAA